MVKQSNAPGLKGKRNKDGSVRWYWEARSDIARRGYRPAAVRLHYPETTEGETQRAARCNELWAEMLSWAANGGEFPPKAFDGTVGSLCRIYETHEHSPMRKMKYNFQTTRSKDLQIILRTVANRRVSRLTGPDFNRWYENWGAPKAPGMPPRPWRAKHTVDAVRHIIAFGVTLRFPGCKDVYDILKCMRFAKPAARTSKMLLEHVQAISQAAHAMGLGSIALATALQFETALRQKDVIGEWFPDDCNAGGGITYKGRRWGTGLLWSDIDDSMILRKKTSKRGVVVEHDLRLCSLAMAEIERVPVERRIGPIIISETTGEPYKNRTFTQTFRRIANRADVPSHIWNMDSRAGAVSEGFDAGANQMDVMKLAGHQDPKTNAKYNRSSLEQTSRVHRLRLAKRSENKR